MLKRKCSDLIGVESTGLDFVDGATTYEPSPRNKDTSVQQTIIENQKKASLCLFEPMEQLAQLVREVERVVTAPYVPSLQVSWAWSTMDP